MTPTIRRHEALIRARDSAEGELAALCREQAADDHYRIGRRGWLVSLDSTDAYGRSLHETVTGADRA